MAHLSMATKLKIIVPVIYLLAANVYFLFTLSSRSVEPHHVIGLVLTELSFIFWLIARFQLGNAFSLAPTAKYLVTTGLYSKLRNPVYYFSVLAVVGIGIFAWNLYVAVLVGALILLEYFRIQKEEQLLEKAFGEDYIVYKKRTWF